MKHNAHSGFVVPIIIGLIALGSAVGVWYNADQEKSKLEDLSRIEQESLELYVANQLEVAANRISFVNGSSEYAKFIMNGTGEPIFVVRKNSSWKIVEPQGGTYSCEQLQATGFGESFLYDCKTKYEKELATTLFTDSKKEAILVGFLQRIDDCAGCVMLTTSEQDEVTFFLDEDDFDDGDYVAVVIPDSEIITINDVSSADLQEAGVPNIEDNGSEEGATSDSSNLGGEGDGSEEIGGETTNENTEEGAESTTSDSSQDGAGDSTGQEGSASIIEEIVDVNDVSVADDGLTDTGVATDPQGGGSPSQDDTGQTGGSSEEAVVNEDQGDGEDNNDTVFDVVVSSSNDDQDIVNFFDLDSSDQDLQVIGDPSEDRQ
jgi:hypothetical protein